jgi:transposase
MEKQARRRFEAQDKITMLKRHLVGGEEVSAICEQQGIAPNQFYRWQNELFENGAAAFQRTERGESSRVKKLTEKISLLESKIVRKEQVIAEIAEDNVKLKKNLGEA